MSSLDAYLRDHGIGDEDATVHAALTGDWLRARSRLAATLDLTGEALALEAAAHDTRADE